MPAGSPIVARSFAAALVVASLPAVVAAGDWYHDYSIARQEAIKLDRPLLIHFHAEWCVPCRKMDRDVFDAPDFLARASRHVVAVKLDVDRDGPVAQRYGVESVPTDLFLAPDGRVLGMMNGIRSKEDYLRRVAAIDGQYARLRDLYLARSDGSPSLHTATDDIGPSFPTRSRPEEEIAPSPIAPEPFASERGGPRVKPRADGTSLLALKGYCPVALHHRRQWVKGDRRFAWEHQGLTYLMASADDLAKFKEEAERYAPRLLGCDPVLYYDDGRAVPGSTGFAAYFDGGLYLFASAANRSKFREEPDRYTRRRTVLLIDEMEPFLR